MNKRFSHMQDGKTKMVDVSGKKKSGRIAIAVAKVIFSKESFNNLSRNKTNKEQILSTARLAGIQASKITSHLIPLCHNLSLDFVDVEFDLDKKNNTVNITSQSKTSERTGVEMEAMVCVTCAALTIYDMCKSIDKKIEISNIKLKYKSGGKSGIFKND